MKIPLHVIFRKKLRSFFTTLLSFLFRTKLSNELIKPEEIKHIVIIRPNYRIGNLIFLTPLIKEFYEQMPHVKIDILVGNKLAGKILEQMPNVERVMDIPRKLLLEPINMWHYIKQTRKVQYDLAINISGGSFSSQIVTSLVNAKYKASFHSSNNFLPLTHIIEREALYTHAGSRPLEFLKLFANVQLPKQEIPLDILLNEEEKDLAKKTLTKLLRENFYNSNIKTIALFRDARFDKKIQDSWWNQFIEAIKEINSDVVFIDILSPDVPTKLRTDMLEYSSKDLRKLGAFFATCSMYVSADTGPLHLASASQARTVALLNKTNSRTYGLLGENDLTININGKTPQEVAKECYK